VGIALVLSILSSLALCLVSTAAADDAAVLPKGRFSFGVENRFFFPADERYSPKGKAEDLAGAFNRTLDASVFPSLSALNPFVAGGRASIGDSSVHFEYHYNILAFAPAYGVTDRLTLGAEIPYYWVHNKVDASVNSAPGSSANVGLRTGPGVGAPCGLPVAVLPLTCPNTRRFTTEDVQQVLGPGLPGIQGFGFKRIENFSADGFGDITLAAKYQFLRTDDWRLAATAGVRLPTGLQHDPDNLADIFWSAGAYTLLARLHHDYVLSNLWQRRAQGAPEANLLQTGNVVLNFTFRYDWILRDKVTIRAGDENALPTYRARVHRDIGDRFEFEFGGRYVVWSPFSGVGTLQICVQARRPYRGTQDVSAQLRGRRYGRDRTPLYRPAELFDDPAVSAAPLPDPAQPLPRLPRPVRRVGSQSVRVAQPGIEDALHQRRAPVHLLSRRGGGRHTSGVLLRGSSFLYRCLTAGIA